MRSILAVAIAAMLLQGCIVTAPCTIAWRSNTLQQVADTEGRNETGKSANTVNADKQTDLSASVPQSKSSTSTKKVVEKLAEKATGKTSSDYDDCPECRN